MYKIDFELDLKSLIDNLEEVEEDTRAGFREVVKDTADNIVKDAQKKAKKKTGALSRSIKANYKRQGLDAEIKADVEYASYVEYGTRAHIIRPKGKKALVFNNGNKLCFSKKVRHPGTKASPFLTPAFDENIPRFIKDLEEVLNGANK